MYSKGVAIVAPVGLEAIDVELFLLLGDLKPRGSINILISTIGEVDQL